MDLSRRDARPILRYYLVAIGVGGAAVETAAGTKAEQVRRQADSEIVGSACGAGRARAAASQKESCRGQPIIPQGAAEQAEIAGCT